MANEEHLARLTQGVEAWRQWRVFNRAIQPDLSEANLFQAHLSTAALTGADLRRAHLVRADLTEADLGRGGSSWGKP
jgi:hypothetical protein